MLNCPETRKRELRSKLKTTKNLKTYRRIIAQLGGLSGSRKSKQLAGAAGGRAKATNRKAR